MKSVLPKTSVTRSVDLLTFTSGTMKSHGRDGFVTAQSVAIDCGHDKLVSPLEPQIHHVIPAKKLETLESNVHNLMRKLTGAMVRAGHAVAQTCLYSLKIKKHAVRLPRLCVMMKIKGARPSLWVPIPDMYGVSILWVQDGSSIASAYNPIKGFVLDLDPTTCSLEMTRILNAFAKVRTTHKVTAEEIVDLDLM